MKFDKTHRKLAAEDIDDFEKRHGISLPENYRSFLTMNNGGIPSAPLYRKSDVALYINAFIPISHGSELNLDDEIRLFPYELRGNLIPIAIEGAGGFICLNTDNGKIYFLDHETDVTDREISPDSLIYLAESIDEFVSYLTGEEEDEYDEIEFIGATGDMGKFEFFIKESHVDRKSRNGRTMIHLAAMNGRIELLKKCVEHGAGLNGLIHIAAKNRHREIVDYLLSIGVDINERDKDGKTALSYVFPFLNKKFHDYLVSKGGIR